MADIKTRLKLRYDSLENWASKNPTLLDGEVAIAYLPPKGTGDAPAATSTAVLMKVGPGAFNSLPFTSALAADVYPWAKEAGLTINKDGTGNVVSGIEWDATANGGKGGIKFTTAAVATAEGLDELQKDVAAIEKDIADNRDTWAKDDNTTYTFAKSADGKGITITPSDGSANTITFAFLTQAEIEALNYLVAADITTGSANGTIAVEGKDVAVKGLQNAAYATVASLNATASGYADTIKTGVEDGTIKAKIATEAESTIYDLTIRVGKEDIVFDGSDTKLADVDEAISVAIGDRTDYTNDEIDDKIEAVLGTSGDAATANTVYGAKAAAAAAQNDATTAKTKIEAFLGAITPEGSSAAIDTLAEIQKYMTDDTQAFTELSTKVTNIENGTTATTAGDLTAELEAEIKGYTVANATKAADADQLGGQAPAYYATATSVTDITKTNGTIDTKVKAAIDAEVIRADKKYELDGAEERAIAAAKSETQNQISTLTTGTINPLANRVKAIEDAPYATKAQVDAKLDANGWTSTNGNLYKTGDNGSVSINGNGVTITGGPNSLTYGPMGITGNVDAHIGFETFEVTYYGIKRTNPDDERALTEVSYPDHSGTIAIDEDFKTVAKTGDYDDLTNKPTLGALAAKDKVASTDFADEVFVFDCGDANGWS